MMRVIATSGSLSWFIVGAYAGVEGVVCIMVATETLTHQDRGVLPTSLWFLVDRALASVELSLPRQ